MATCDVTNELIAKHFTIIRYIRSADELIYAVTYDVYGQVVFVELNSNEASTTAGVQVHNMHKHDYIEYPFATKDYYKNKLNGSIYGVVLTRGENICSLVRTDAGNVTETYYGSHESLNRTIHTYCVFKYSDIMEDLDISLQSIAATYEMIQQRQLVVNKQIYTETLNEVNKLSIYMATFDKVYKNYSANILDDWSRFSNVSVDYLDKLFDTGLTKEEKEKFSYVSANLFARFQAFNNVGGAICELSAATTALMPIKNALKDSIEQFENDNTLMSGKIMDVSEINVLV